MLDVLKKLSPTHEPVFYLIILLGLYQIFIQKQPVDDNWLQYVIELVAAGGVRQLVKPTAKLKETSNEPDGSSLTDR